MNDWKNNTWSLDELRAHAKLYGPKGNVGAMAFLWGSGVVPTGLEWKRRNRLPRFNLSRDSIPAVYLAELAYEFDQEGPLEHPTEFVNWLEYEVAGPDRVVISKVLSSLGRTGDTNA